MFPHSSSLGSDECHSSYEPLPISESRRFLALIGGIKRRPVFADPPGLQARRILSLNRAGPFALDSLSLLGRRLKVGAIPSSINLSLPHRSLRPCRSYRHIRPQLSIVPSKLNETPSSTQRLSVQIRCRLGALLPICVMETPMVLNSPKHHHQHSRRPLPCLRPP